MVLNTYIYYIILCVDVHFKSKVEIINNYLSYNELVKNEALIIFVNFNPLKTGYRIYAYLLHKSNRYKIK